MEKVYALEINYKNFTAKVESGTGWQKSSPIEKLTLAKSNGETIIRWNAPSTICPIGIFISFSRKDLLKKWQEEQEKMIKQREEEIAKIREIILK